MQRTEKQINWFLLLQIHLVATSVAIFVNPSALLIVAILLIVPALALFKDNQLLFNLMNLMKTYLLIL